MGRDVGAIRCYAIAVLEWIRGVTGATNAALAERVQTLWGGYGEVVRVRLEGAPVPSVIVKQVTPPPGRGRSHERKLRSYDVERAWYRGFATRCDERCRVPRCWAAERVDGGIERPNRVGKTAPRQGLPLEALHAPRECDALPFPDRMDLRAWLSSLGLERYAAAFAEQDVDAAVLGELAEEDLATLGVASLGHRKKLMAAIRRIGESGVGFAAAGGGATTVNLPNRGGASLESISEGLARSLDARGYRIVRRLGQGGMGAVFLARQESVGREVALKVLRAHGDAEGGTRFAREARAIGALTHPNSVRLYDFVMEGDEACIVMEYVEGESLAELIQRERRLPVRLALAIVTRVCDALTEAHAKGIVHRDLKPANILLQGAHGHEAFPRVLDFGLARWTSVDESRLTRTGAVCGTPRYLSPEQIQGSEVTLQSDLYALGVVLYEMLAGRPPFEASVDAALLYQHLKEPPPPLPGDLLRPAGLDAVLERVLAKSPALRPSSAYALRRDLAALLGPETLDRHRRPPSSTTSTRAALSAAPERRRVCVLDAELFAPTAQDADDARHAVLGRCRAAAAAVRRRHGGYLEGVDGAHQTWVFGAPIARRDDARRALAAALDLVAVLSGVDGAAPRIGVAAGFVVAGGTTQPDGSAEADDRYFVVGAPLREASRLRAGAAAAEVLVEPALIDPEHDDTQPSRVHGAVRLVASARVVSSSSVELPFVGRSREIGEIEAALERCRATGTGRVVVVSGEAGIGKSRLLDRARRAAEGTGVRSARALVSDAEVAPENDVTRQLVDELLALGSADPEGRAAALEAQLAGTLGAAHWPSLFHFLGVPLSGTMQRIYDALEPSARRAGYRDMLAALLGALCREGPLALIVEDMHWADGPTLDAVETLCGIAGALPVLLVLTSRIEGEEQWRHCLAGQTVIRLELGPLTADEAEALARRLGGSTERRTRAVSRASGHPLLLTEMLRGGADPSESLPPTIHGLVHARLDRLPERDRAAIQVAAVLGARGEIEQLRDVLGDAEYDAAKLVDYRLLERAAGRYAFIHALVRDAVYDAIVDDRRRALHERCAERVEYDPGVAAMHLERAGSARAPEAYSTAARRALDVDRYEDARHLAERGARLADGPARLGLLELRGQTELLLGDAKAAHESFAAMAAVADGDDDRYRAAVGRADALRVGGRPDGALAALDEAETLAERAGIEAGRAFYLRGGVCFATGRLEACRAAHERALDIARRTEDLELMARASSGLADAFYGSGRIASAAPIYEECIARSGQARLLGVEALNLPMLAIVSVFMNDLERARELAAQAIERGRELSHKRAETLGLGAASLSAFHAGDFERGAQHAEAALELTQETGSVVFEQTAHYYLARSWLGAGDREAARAHAERGLSSCRAHGMSFVGAALAATRARLCDDEAERRALIREGAAVVRGASLSFNRFWFRENAIEEALERGDATAAREHAVELRVQTADEPFAWADHVVARAEALADELDGLGDSAALESALAAARAAGLRLTMPALERALVTLRAS